MSLVPLSNPKDPMTYANMSPITAQKLAYNKAEKLGDPVKEKSGNN
jgi:hypothetical protein